MRKRGDNKLEKEIYALLKGAWKLYSRGKIRVAWGMFQRVLKIDYAQPRAWYGIGRIWYQRGNYHNAKTCFKKAWILDKQWYYLKAYGVACIKLRWYSEASRVKKILSEQYGGSLVLPQSNMGIKKGNVLFLVLSFLPFFGWIL